MFQRLILIPLFLSIMACSHQEIILTQSEIQTLKNETQQSRKSPDELQAEYKNKLDTFGGDLLKFYSPLNMSNADNNLIKANHFLNNNNVVESKYYWLAALKNIDEALRNKSAVKLHLKKADSHYQALQKLSAETFFSERFKLISKEYLKLITLIELKDIQEAIQLEGDLILLMLALEIDTLIQKELSESKSLIAEAISINAEKYTPLSLKLAKQALNDSERFIRKSFRDRQTIKEKAQHTQLLASELLYAAKEAYKIHEGSYQDIEMKILNDFEFIHKIKETQGLIESNFEAHAIQQKHLISILNAKQKKVVKKPQLDECRGEKAILAAKLEQLEKDFAYQNRSIISKETNKAVLPELFK